jgi:hypothetical protein
MFLQRTQMDYKGVELREKSNRALVARRPGRRLSPIYNGRGAAGRTVQSLGTQSPNRRVFADLVQLTYRPYSAPYRRKLGSGRPSGGPTVLSSGRCCDAATLMNPAVVLRIVRPTAKVGRTIYRLMSELRRSLCVRPP